MGLRRVREQPPGSIYIEREIVLRQIAFCDRENLVLKGREAEILSISHASEMAQRILLKIAADRERVRIQRSELRKKWNTLLWRDREIRQSGLCSPDEQEMIYAIEYDYAEDKVDAFLRKKKPDIRPFPGAV